MINYYKDIIMIKALVNLVDNLVCGIDIVKLIKYIRCNSSKCNLCVLAASLGARNAD